MAPLTKTSVGKSHELLSKEGRYLSCSSDDGADEHCQRQDPQNRNKGEVQVGPRVRYDEAVNESKEEADYRGNTQRHEDDPVFGCALAVVDAILDCFSTRTPIPNARSRHFDPHRFMRSRGVSVYRNLAELK